MQFLKKIKDRYNILIAITFILLGVLTFRLASLTIADGQYYRELADTKRVKEIYTTAPRGEIRDRYGRLLAGNIPRFTVQLLKDEITPLDTEEKNQSFLSLIRLLEEDGVSYVEDYPIDFNVFKYNSPGDYLNYDVSPTQMVVDLIVENNLLPEVLDSYYVNGDYDDHFTFITANRVLHSIRNKEIEVPVNARLVDGSVSFYYTDTDIDNWKNSIGISSEASAKSAVLKLIDNDTSIIRSILSHPISRELVYEILVDNSIQGNIVLEKYANSYEENYFIQKVNLMKLSDKISLETSAREDFIYVFMNTSIENFLYNVYEEEEETIIPGRILIDLIEKRGVDSPVELNINDNNDISYTYIGDEPLEEEETPVDKLIELGEHLTLFGELLTEEDTKVYAQRQLLEDGINPRISISNFEYVEINNLKEFYSANRIDEGSTVEESFESLSDSHGIDESLSRHEKRSILMIYQVLNKQGHLAYQPINIAYGVKDVTVARIEESLADANGIDISIEPVRYYPEGQSAAHILGTLGKISQASEIEEYVVNKEYSPNAIIGKTGVEQSFEDNLKGKDGTRKVEVDVVGNTTEIIDEEKSTPGDTVYLSIDSKLQKVAEESLQQTLEKLQVGGTYESEWGNYKFGTSSSKGRPYKNATSGAIVAIEVKTGQLLAMASYPAYDPNLFSTGISSTDWQSLFPEDDENPLAPRPLYNIATQTSVQPGSTFKVVTGLAALDKGLSPETRIRDMGIVHVGDKEFRCLIHTMTGGTHGWLNLYDALEVSCNYYFYTLALGRNQKTGEPIEVKLELEDIAGMAEQLGLNDKSGIEINIPAEASGGVPSRVTKLMGSKALLRNMLNSDIRDYIKDGVTIDDDELKEIIDKIVDWMEFENDLSRNEIIKRLDSFGLEPEIILSGKRSGLADQIKFDHMMQAEWSIANTLGITIGEEQGSYTPIQMANMMSTIVNGGYKHNITLIDSIKTSDKLETIYEYTTDSERIALNDYEDLQHVMRGMKQVSQSGTSRRIFENFPVETGSKTGTAGRDGLNPVTKETYDDFSWFIGFAPYDDPEIAVAAIVFQGGAGGHSGPMARDVMAEYLGLNMSESDDSLPYSNSTLNP